VIIEQSRWVHINKPAQSGSPWLEWVQRHGIKPEDVVVDSDIECDDIARTITYQHPDGRFRVMQLEAPALPFPVSHEFDTGYSIGDEGTIGGEKK
jgi:hypothetical protein